MQEVIKTNLYKDGGVFFDLLDSGKSGELEVWMKQMSEAELADELCDLDKELDDVEYVKGLSFIICGVDYLKPSFHNFYEILSIEGVQTFFGVCVSLTLKQKMILTKRSNLTSHMEIFAKTVAWYSRGRSWESY